MNTVHVEEREYTNNHKHVTSHTHTHVITLLLALRKRLREHGLFVKELHGDAAEEGRYAVRLVQVRRNLVVD